ncbi:MAG: YraN family protein [Bacteroidales bacterium]|nr:YraN family protein [Bacteroidales bacterium]
MAKTARKAAGDRAENLALEFLLGKGWRLLDRNWMCVHKELDLVMMGSDGLHVVEVRSRTVPAVIGALDSVDGKKAMKVYLAAMSYVRYHHLGDVCLSLDVVALDFGQGGELLSMELHEGYIRPVFIAGRLSFI